MLGPEYLKGIGIGLVVAWVTSASAYLVVHDAPKNNWRAKVPVAKLVIGLELVLSVIFLALSYLA